MSPKPEYTQWRWSDIVVRALPISNEIEIHYVPDGSRVLLTMAEATDFCSKLLDALADGDGSKVLRLRSKQ